MIDCSGHLPQTQRALPTCRETAGWIAPPMKTDVAHRSSSEPAPRASNARWLLAGVSAVLLVAFGPISQPQGLADDHEPTIHTPRPTSWMPHRRMKCQRVPGHSKWKMCDGPRRSPRPFGDEAFVAGELGLGTLKAAQKLLHKPPDPSWVAAVKGAAHKTLLWPVEHGRFGRGFGYTRKRRRSLRHNGIDIGAPEGTLVRAVNDGIVAYSDNTVRGFGNTVAVIHKDATVTFYCHQRENYVFAGQQVRRGQVVGEVGSTGISRGPHLHMQWHVRGRPRNPMRHMVGRPRARRGRLAFGLSSTRWL